MKRFWTAVETVEGADCHSITLDGRLLKTPARVPLVVPNRKLAEAIAREWRDCGDQVDPRAMPLTGLANAAIDRVATDKAAFAANLARYAEADALCYRADAPQSLIDRQAATWDPLLDWARDRFGIEFVTGTGIVHLPQPRATVETLSQAVAELDSFQLAALAPLVTISGSLVTALAVVHRAIGIDQAIEAVTLDERWQLERWGADEEAEAVLDLRGRDLSAAAGFLDLLRD